MFRENLTALERLANQDTVALGVVSVDFEPIRLTPSEDIRRAAIIACCENPFSMADIAVLGTIEVDKTVRTFGPIGESVGAYDDSLHQGVLTSLVRGYASLLTVLGIKVLVPVRMETEALKRWKDRRKRRKGDWLVVQPPGSATKYKSSQDPPETDLGLIEFDPVDADCFHREMEVVSEQDFRYLIDAKDDISLSSLFEPEHPDAVFWRMLHGDLEKDPETNDAPVAIGYIKQQQRAKKLKYRDNNNLPYLSEKNCP